MTIGFNYNQNQSHWLMLGPGLIDWVTGGAHLGLYRNYASLHVDDTFTSDNTWNTATHANDFTASLRMVPSDVDREAQWSRANNFRLDQLPNFGNSVVYQAEHGGVDPLLAEFQKTDPATGKPYTQDFGWLSHTWDHAYLDTAAPPQNYIEAELNAEHERAQGGAGRHPGHRRARSDREHGSLTAVRDGEPARVRTRRPLRPRKSRDGHARRGRPAHHRRRDGECSPAGRSRPGATSTR